MKICPYKDGDESRIAYLFERVFGRSISEEWWRWRYLDNPVDRPRIMLAWDGDALAGHYAVSPFRLRIGEEVKLAALSMTTMTDPDYQGQGLFPRLAEALYSEIARDGFACVVGFPNYRIHVPRIEKLGWHDIVAIHNLRVCRQNVRSGKADGKWVYESGAPKPADAECVPREPTFTVRVAWDAASWMWRIASGSGQDYRVLRVRNASKEAERAAVVWKTYANDSIDVVHFAATSSSALSAAIGKLCENTFNGTFEAINVWSSLHDPLHRVFESLGFRATAPVTYFGGRVFSAMPATLSPEKWRLTMLTSDVY